MSPSNSSSLTSPAFPSTGELEEMAGRGRGTFDDVPFPLLLRAFAEHPRTGVLEVKRRRVVKSIMLERGLPVHCRSNVAQERFGNFLVKVERISKAELASSLSESLVQEVPIGTILLRKGLVTASELLRLLQHCLVAQLCDVFTWEEGDFVFLHEEPESYAPLKIRVHQLLLTGASRFTPQSHVDAAVGALGGGELALHPRPPAALEGLRLDDGQRRVVRAFEEPQALEQLQDELEIAPDEAARLVYSLGIAGLLVPAERLASVRRSPASADARALSPGDRSGGSDRADSATVARLFLDHRRLDAFDLLGLDEDAGRADVEAAYLSLSGRLAPWVFGGGSEGVLAEQARSVYLSAANAYSELCDPERRGDATTRRRNLRERRDAKRTVGPQRIETDLLDPERQYEKGLKLLAEGKLAAALEQFDFASDCDPQNGTYRAQAALLRHQCSRASAEQALTELGEARRIDPGCGLAFLYAGEIATGLNRFDEAEELLRRANVLMKPDRRPIERLKELATRRKKRRR